MNSHNDECSIRVYQRAVKLELRPLYIISCSLGLAYLRCFVHFHSFQYEQCYRASKFFSLFPSILRRMVNFVLLSQAFVDVRGVARQLVVSDVDCIQYSIARFRVDYIFMFLLYMRPKRLVVYISSSTVEIRV